MDGFLLTGGGGALREGPRPPDLLGVMAGFTGGVGG